ncbi:hypothetical protein MMC14_001251 [Varicellaria rhodocarpa]|nr:hypothetical protein [Varicellaria rhodocarpa]
MGFLTGILAFRSYKPTCHSHNVSYSPAKSAVQFAEQKDLTPNHDTYGAYSGAPNPNQTRAWEELLSPVMIRASSEEMALAGELSDTSVELFSGGFLASLGVYHDLHCLRRIRFYIYKDLYYPNITSQQQSYEEMHVEHCLEKLRISAMCTGDVGLYTFAWKPDRPRPITKSSAARNCVNWDTLESWAKSRSAGYNPRLKPQLLRPKDNAVFLHLPE